MNNMSQSFITGALNRLCQGKTNSYGANLANYIAGSVSYTHLTLPTRS